MNHRDRMRMRQGVEAQRLGAGSLRADGSPQSIELHIDQLLMEGMQPSDRYQFGHAVQTELARLLTEQGIPANVNSSAQLERLAAGNFAITSAPRPATVGRQVAEAVYRGIGQGNFSGNSSGPAGGSMQ